MDLISRQATYLALVEKGQASKRYKLGETWELNGEEIREVLDALPSAQPEPLSDAYMKAVWTWLLDYQIKAAKLKGRYTPYEVLSWVANYWRKEHE